MLTGQSIIGSKQTFIIEKVSVPEWNYGDIDATEAYVYARTLSGDHAGAVRNLAERQEAAEGEEQEALSMAGWCVLGICDEHGQRLFTEDDIPALMARSLVALQRCSAAVLALNPIDGGEEEEASDDAPKVD